MSRALPGGITLRKGLFVALVAVISMLAGATGAVLASHQFSDVSNSHPFHDEISLIADAGITTGFGDGTFRPGDPVTRQAMAAFLARGLGLGSNPPVAKAATVRGGTSVQGSCLLDGSEGLFADCGAPATVSLAGSGRILAIATGTWVSVALNSPARGSCRLTVNGVVFGPGFVPMGELVDTTGGFGRNHFVLQGVTAELPAGDHMVRLQCTENVNDMDWFNVMVTGIGFQTG